MVRVNPEKNEAAFRATRNRNSPSAPPSSRLQFFLDRLNSYQTQATLVTGFAFTAFSADALRELPYRESPIRSWLFASFAAMAMGSAVAVVCISSYLMARVEKLALTTSVGAGLAAVRQRLPTVTAFYFVSLVGLFGAASTLQFAMCHDPDDDTCELVGVSVVIVFFSCCLGACIVLNRIRLQFDCYQQGTGSAVNPLYLASPVCGSQQPLDSTGLPAAGLAAASSHS